MEWQISVNDLSDLPLIAQEKLVFKTHQVSRLKALTFLNHVPSQNQTSRYLSSLIVKYTYVFQNQAIQGVNCDDRTIEHHDVNLLLWIQKMVQIIATINLGNNRYLAKSFLDL